MKTATIYIYDFIGEGGYSAKDFAQDLEDFKTNGADKIELHVNSPGGSVFDGFAMYNNLKQYDVDVYIDGQAASIATVIAMAGKKIHMYRNTRFLIHNPSSFAWGEQKEFEKTKNELEKIKSSIIDLYANRTGLSTEEISKMMDEETSLTADEAKEKGFIDEVLVTIKEKNYVGVYINYIEDNVNPNKKDKKMNEELLKFFGLDANSTEEQLTAKLTDLKKDLGLEDNSTVQNIVDRINENGPDAAKIAEFENTITTLTTENETLKAEKLALENAKKQSAAETLVDKAIEDWKILPADREIWVNTAIANFEDAKAKLDAKEKDSTKPSNIRVNENNLDKENPAAIANAAVIYIAEMAKVGLQVSYSDAVNAVFNK